MTSRLKRKLNDIGVDPASAKANESFCQIGTPLPPLEKSKDTGEFVPLWKQEVRDEKGRRRLHGAFTGGFSAGYFNTVGSKEGWTPATFVSSRSERAKKKALRPEDFMDEEDLSELRESRNLVDEHEEMDFGGTDAELRRRAAGDADEGQDSMASMLEASLAPAPKDSVGARILKKMGWRLGQGIGPRVTYAQRKAQDLGYLDPGVKDEPDEDEEAKKHLYPRRDTPVLLAPRKGNSHGLGYTPGMDLNESLGRASEQSKGPKLAAGFGLGALNDADDDDLDVYDGGAGAQARSRMAYDATHPDDDSGIIMGSSLHAVSRHRGVDNTTSSVGTQTFRDGQPVLKGFVLSDKPVAEDRWFPLPDIPTGWKPNPRKVWDRERNKENEPVKEKGKTTQSHAEWKNSLLSANERGSMLGETPLTAQPRSVFDYLSEKDKERLQNVKNHPPEPSTSAAPTTAPPAPPSLPRPSNQINIPYLHPSVAKAALQGFKPFTSDPIKQSRYTAFLHFRAQSSSGVDSSPAPIAISPSPGQSIEEFNHELEDYAKSATVFKPLSGAMAGRFTSAAIIENGPRIIEGLHQPDAAAEEEQKQEEATLREKDDPKMGAVRLGMYGPLTREVLPWQPAKLLCKRFGVKDPEVDLAAGAEDAQARPKDAWTPPEAGSAGAEPPHASADASVGAITDGGASGSGDRRRRNLANVGLGEDDDQGKDTLTYERPPMDIFKAIFASDDEDSDDEDDGQGETSPEPAAVPAATLIKQEPVPAHLAMGSSSEPSYDPQGSAVKQSAPVDEKVDIATFKPTFIPRAERESRRDNSKDKDRDKGKKDKKKKAGKAVALMSFDVEEDGVLPTMGVPAPGRVKNKSRHSEHDKERKKKKRKERKDEDDDEAMWVEKPPPEVVKTLHADPEPTMGVETPTFHMGNDSEGALHRARKRAIDFM